MKIKTELSIFLIVICFLFSISAVCADEIQTDIINGDSSYQLNMSLTQNLNAEPISQDCCYDSNQNSDDDLKLSSGEVSSSFSQFCEDLNKSAGEFNLNHSYKHDEMDRENSAIFYIDNLVINGNNNILDGKGSNFQFKFYEKTNITINDLTFINFNNSQLQG